MSDLFANSGWEILATNWRHIGHELDIIASRGPRLKIIEVKCRRKSAIDLVDLEQLVSAKKRAALKRGANVFLSKIMASFDQIQFDLVVVLQKQNHTIIRHFENFME